MLTIRREQVDVFRKALRCSFENEMVAHLTEFSPPLFSTVKEGQLRKAIRRGLDSADGYGFNFRGPVRLYLELMLLFGSSFDTDPQYPWAREILSDPDSDPQMQRAVQLYDRARDYRRHVAGARDSYRLSALKEIAVLARRPLAVPRGDVVPSMLWEMARVYPQKAAYVGEDRLEILIGEGIDVARKRGLSTLPEVALTVLLMFAFGHGCFDDPLCAWMVPAVDMPHSAVPLDLAGLPERKPSIWREQVLGYIEEGVKRELS